MPDEEHIRRRAHEIWEREGQPEGRHEEHWERARREVKAEKAGLLPEPAAPGASPADVDTTPGQAGSGQAGGERPPPDAGATEVARIID
jgi:hypothetical protein